MFTIDPKITDIKVKEKNVLKILFSMNEHQVATPEMILENARTYVIFFRESDGTLSAYIALYLLETNRKLFYSFSSNPFSQDTLDNVEEEALAFAEGLGAMLDELDFARISNQEQDRWLDEQEIFKPESHEEKGAAVSDRKPAAVRDAITGQEIRQSADASAVLEPKPTKIELPAQPTTVQATPVIQQPAPTVQESPPPASLVPPPVSHPVQNGEPVQEAPAKVVPVYPTQQAGQPKPVRSSGTVAEEFTPLPVNTAVVPPVQTVPQQAAPKPSRQVSPQNAASPKTKQHAVQKQGKQTTPKQEQAPPLQPSSGMVSRDREALARLLTSF